MSDERQLSKEGQYVIHVLANDTLSQPEFKQELDELLGQEDSVIHAKMETYLENKFPWMESKAIVNEVVPHLQATKQSGATGISDVGRVSRSGSIFWRLLGW